MRKRSLPIDRIALVYVHRPDPACSTKKDPLYQIRDLVEYAQAMNSMLI